MNALNTLNALLLACVLSASSAAASVDGLRNALRAANAANDGAQLIETAAELRAQFPGHPTYGYLLARGQALRGDNDAALQTLHGLAARGADMLANTQNDAAFASLVTMPGFAALEKQAALLREPIGEAAPAWRFGTPDTIPEAVAVGADGRVYLGSVRQREVLVRETDGTVTHWRHPGLWSVQGLHLSPDETRLWIATSAMNVTRDVSAGEAGQSALAAFDVKTGELVARHVLPLDGEHVLGDFVFLDATSLLATDSVGGGVYSLDTQTGKFTQRVAPGTLRSPQGLAPLGRFVYIADYGNGLYRFDPADNSLQRVDDGPASPYGIDGLYAYGATLLAIQNGVRPQQVARFTLAKDGLRIVTRETLLANHRDFDEPTLGTVIGDRLFLVANSQWNHFTPDGRLPGENLEPPVILSLELPRISRR